jgi:hypothetical protein
MPRCVASTWTLTFDGDVNPVQKEKGKEWTLLGHAPVTGNTACASWIEELTEMQEPYPCRSADTRKTRSAVSSVWPTVCGRRPCESRT